MRPWAAVRPPQAPLSWGGCTNNFIALLSAPGGSPKKSWQVSVADCVPAQVTMTGFSGTVMEQRPLHTLSSKLGRVAGHGRCHGRYWLAESPIGEAREVTPQVELLFI